MLPAGCRVGRELGICWAWHTGQDAALDVALLSARSAAPQSASLPSTVTPLTWYPQVRSALGIPKQDAKTGSSKDSSSSTSSSRGLTALVNNAGKVTLAPLEFMPVEVFEDQLQVGGDM